MFAASTRAAFVMPATVAGSASYVRGIILAHNADQPPSR
jgi:hypothetical protein